MRHRDRETTQFLNDQYRLQWERAERLQAELDHIKKGHAYRWMQTLRAMLGRRDTVPVAATPVPGAVRDLSRLRVPARGKVSIIIPFRDRADLLWPLLSRIHRSSYRDREVILVDHASTGPSMFRLLARMERRPDTRIVPMSGPFNFSRLCNAGARVATGETLVFLNNDTEPLNKDWIERLLESAQHPAIGAVGGSLFYPDGSVQHVGLFPKSDGSWHHADRGLPQQKVRTRIDLRMVRSVPAVSGACLAIRRSLFLDLGGFSEELPITYNDVDLCQRLRARGLEIAVAPGARLIHYESLTRGYSTDHLTAQKSLVSQGSGA